MDRNRFSHIAHGGLPLWNPVGTRHLQGYLDQLALSEEGTVLDIGCGRGHVLNLLLSRFKAKGAGVDSSPYAMATAKRDLAGHVATGRLSPGANI